MLLFIFILSFGSCHKYFLCELHTTGIYMVPLLFKVLRESLTRFTPLNLHKIDRPDGGTASTALHVHHNLDPKEA